MYNEITESDVRFFIVISFFIRFVYNLFMLGLVFKAALYFNNYWLLIFAVVLKVEFPKFDITRVDDDDDAVDEDIKTIP